MMAARNVQTPEGVLEQIPFASCASGWSSVLLTLKTRAALAGVAGAEKQMMRTRMKLRRITAAVMVPPNRFFPPRCGQSWVVLSACLNRILHLKPAIITALFWQGRPLHE